MDTNDNYMYKSFPQENPRAVEELSPRKINENRRILTDRFNYMQKRNLIPQMSAEERDEVATHYAQFGLNHKAKDILFTPRKTLATRLLDSKVDDKSNLGRFSKRIVNLALLAVLAYEVYSPIDYNPNSMNDEIKYNSFDFDSLYHEHEEEIPKNYHIHTLPSDDIVYLNPIKDNDKYFIEK